MPVPENEKRTAAMRLPPGIYNVLGLKAPAAKVTINTDISIQPVDPVKPTGHHVQMPGDHSHCCGHHHETPRVALDISTPSKAREGLGSAFFRHAKANLPIETFCIAACEVGELGGEFMAYASGLQAFNEYGLAAGILTGLTYATYHVMKDHSWLSSSDHDCQHDHDHGKLENMSQVALYILTAETGCVLSATTVEYAFGKFLGNDGAPWDPENLAVRLIGLPVAFGVGLFVMSAGTLAREKYKDFRESQ